MKDIVRINFDFPRSEYPFLKMMCAQKGLSLKTLATELILKEIEAYEDQFLAQKAEERMGELDASDNISFDEAAKLAGWNDDEKV